MMKNKAQVGAKCTEWRLRGQSTERTVDAIVSSGLDEATIMLCSTGNQARMLIKFTPTQFLEFKRMVDHCARRFQVIDEVWEDRFRHSKEVKAVKSLMDEGHSLMESVAMVRREYMPMGYEAVVLSEWLRFQEELI